MQFEMSKESLKECIILKAYKNLGSFFLESNSNFLSSHVDKIHVIELELRKTLFLVHFTVFSSTSSRFSLNTLMKTLLMNLFDF